MICEDNFKNVYKLFCGWVSYCVCKLQALSLSMDPLSICTTRINDTARLVCKFNFIVIFVILL